MSETQATERRPSPALRSPLLQVGAEATAFAMMAFAASAWVLNVQREEVARAFAEDWLREQGVARVFTPKDFGLTDIMGQVVDVIREANGLGDKALEPA